MSNIKNKSKICLETEAFEVSVINDPEMRPFLNVFQVEGKNIQQQKLGKVFGIIQVDDNTENSAYLPNLLAQVFKKEYYKNKNKDCGQSFEIALHKMNLTLTELAQHEIVKWINNLNAVIGVVCEKEIHFTQIGKGVILFLKDKKIIKLDAEGSKTEDYHPMKTFSSISAGRIKKGDKIIFTIKETFKTLKIEELERHYKTFNSDEFDNIISSTLRNEASSTGMLVINVKENQTNALENIATPEPTVDEDFNFFGKNKTKKNKNELTETPQVNLNLKSKEIKKNPEGNQEDSNYSKSPFEKEPEIFLKEEESAEEEKEELVNKFNLISKISEKNYQKKLLFLKKLFQKWLKKPSIKKITFNKIEIEKFQKYSEKNIPRRPFFQLFDNFKKWFLKIDFNKIKNFSQNKSSQIINYFKKHFSKINFEKNKNFLNKIKNFRSINSIENKQIEIKKTNPSLNLSPSENNFSKKEILANKLKRKSQILRQQIIKLSQKFIGWVKKRNFNKKIVLISLVILVFIVISLILILNKKSSIDLQSSQSEGFQNNIPAEEIKTVSGLTNLISLNKEIKDTIFLKNDLFLLTEEDSLIKYSVRDNKKTEILLPEKLKNALYLSPIESLQLILITSPNQVFSYSPITNKFSENNLVLPENFENIGTGTYLTYLYLLDRNNGQVYRYYRTTGGFGEFKPWFKEAKNMETVSSFDVSDSIYLAFENGQLEKYFQGKREKSFRLGENFIPDKIRVKLNKEEIFALDSEKGIIIKLLENKNQQSLFEDKNFKDSSNFSVDFDNKKVYLVNKKDELVVFNY